MKLYSTFFSILFLGVISLQFSACSTAKKDDSEIPALIESDASAASKTAAAAPENEAIKTEYDKAVLALKGNPDDMKQYISLASAFIMEGRVTGSGNYYSNAAVKMLNKVIENSGGKKDLVFQALSLKSAVLLNMHQFKDALDVAQQAVAIDSFNSGVYGALVDANVELGHYDAAVHDCDRMLTIRPDLRSYSRASYLRQIYGDNAGAIAAMNMAVQAGVPGAESTEWARVHLGDLYLGIGKIDSAYFEYQTALNYRPNYPYAQIGIAKANETEQKYDTALINTKKAINTMSEAAFVSFLGDIYELKGDSLKAHEVRNDVVKLMEDGEKNQPKDDVIKHNVSREMSLAYLNAGKADKALEYAKKDYDMRPDNIDANELLAWIYYLKGDNTNAQMHADKMLKTNTKNANTLYKAGVIYAGAGNAAKGNELITQAKAINPTIDKRILNQTRRG